MAYLNKAGYVYCATTERDAREDLMKIGWTKKSVGERMKSLETAGVSCSFYPIRAKRVNDCKKVEKQIHTLAKAFGAHHYKEWYKITIDQVHALFDLVQVSELSPPKKKKVVRCYNCGKIGHYSPMCRKIQSGNHRYPHSSYSSFTSNRTHIEHY